MQRAICGGIVQEERRRESLDALIEMVAITALHCAKLFRFDDLYEDLSQRSDGNQTVRRRPKSNRITTLFASSDLLAGRQVSKLPRSLRAGAL